MIRKSLMYIDVHVHSYPTMAEGGTIWHWQGISWEKLEEILKIKEQETEIKHGVFYGPHQKILLRHSHETLWKKLSEEDRQFLSERVVPMLENHRLQTLGVVSWERIKELYKFEESEKLKNQIDATKFIADNKGIAIIDLPRRREKEVKGGNSVYRNNPGAVSVKQLINLPDYVRERTFLCYNAMEPNFWPFYWRREAEKVSEETGLKLLGGSDVVSSPSSMFRAYSEAQVDKISDLLENPNFLGELHKGSVSLFREGIRRYWVCGFIEYFMGYERRERRVQKRLKKWVEKTK